MALSRSLHSKSPLVWTQGLVFCACAIRPENPSSWSENASRRVWSDHHMAHLSWFSFFSGLRFLKEWIWIYICYYFCNISSLKKILRWKLFLNYSVWVCHIDGCRCLFLILSCSVAFLFLIYKNSFFINHMRYFSLILQVCFFRQQSLIVKSSNFMISDLYSFLYYLNFLAIHQWD